MGFVVENSANPSAERTIECSREANHTAGTTPQEQETTVVQIVVNGVVNGNVVNVQMATDNDTTVEEVKQAVAMMTQGLVKTGQYNRYLLFWKSTLASRQQSKVNSPTVE